MAGGDRRAPEGDCALALGLVEAVGHLEPGGVVARRRLEADGVAGAHDALAEHARVHAAVGGVRLHGKPSEAQVAEGVPNRAARVRGLRDLEHHLVADGQPRPGRQQGNVEALGRQVLAGRARPDRVALGGHAPDGLDPQDGDGAMRAAMHRVACLPVTLDSEGRDAGGLDRQLRDAAVRDVHLEQPALNHADGC